MQFRRAEIIRIQGGFTLVEIAVVLVVIGLIIGAVIKGQELINSSRVRSLAESASGVRSACLAFIGRYKKIPGDWAAADASIGIGVTINNPAAGVTTANNGRLDNPSGADTYAEPNALWEQLSKAEFIQGSFSGANAVPTAYDGLTPLNVFGAPVIVGRTNEYLDALSPPPSQLHIYIGRLVPVAAMRELDLKIDDGLPRTGALRATIPAATIFIGGSSGWGGMDASCVDGASPPNWNTAADSHDCNAVLLF